MRISAQEQQAIVGEIQKKASNAKIYLYGSRANDQLSGGDIDLLVVSADLDLMDRVDLLIDIKARIGEQKIDLKIVPPEQLSSDVFVQSILPTAVRLD